MEAGEKQKTVLVVEDDRFLADLLVRKLKKDGYNTLCTINGSEALEMLQNNGVDIVLLDILLPGISGFDVLTAMKQNQKTKETPVLILSNLGDKEDMAKAKELGANDYIIKADFDLNQITERLSLTLSTKS